MSFTLINLDSQLDAVARLTRGWQPNEVLSWLSQQGTLVKIYNPHDERAHFFTSQVGICTALTVLDDGTITVVREHTTKTPRGSQRSLTSDV